MSEYSPFNAAPDPELGQALREALPTPFGAAFVQRVRARLSQQRQRGWDDELAAWFWQGLVAASAAAILAGWGVNRVAVADQSDETTASVTTQLLDGSAPGATVLLASMTSKEVQ
ncbi:MAG TPA: hypothetical protein VHW65_01055 [Gemmatimonadales bacterium]|jgi:hypothetical protein|nr:hypothetical protein [Gemmatimonadales bacterium]